MALAGRLVVAALWLLFSPSYSQTTMTTTSVLPNASSTTPTSTTASTTEDIHEGVSLTLLFFILLLILTVLTVWFFKQHRVRYVHETGLSILYGLIMGVVIRYGLNAPGYTPVEKDVEEEVIFDPEIFFYVLLPPIIFHAGYSMKRRHFFRNIGAILTFAFVGTIISAVVIGAIMYGLTRVLPYDSPLTTTRFSDFLYFGSILSATDPVTVLAIFHDLHVDVDLYALVFGESVLNDAVAIVLSRAVKQFRDAPPDQDVTLQVFISLGSFVGVFVGSLLLGTLIGFLTAFATKFTKIREHPLLETALMFLTSYSAYLVSESLQLSGIVGILFCGIAQAHYTFNNLSDESRDRTRKVSELLNFFAENFVFLYIGVSTFTEQNQKWDPAFIFISLFAMLLSRAVQIYPLSFLLNLGRKQRIPWNFQNMMMYSGLRGAIAFALTIRGLSGSDVFTQLMFSTTLVLVMITVVIFGGLTLTVLTALQIRVGVTEDKEMQTAPLPVLSGRRYDGQTSRSIRASVASRAYQDASTMRDSRATAADFHMGSNTTDRAKLVKWWNKLDNKVFKPVLTNYHSTLEDAFPTSKACMTFSSIFTSKRQRDLQREVRVESDDELILEDNEIDVVPPGPLHPQRGGAGQPNGSNPNKPIHTGPPVEADDVYFG